MEIEILDKISKRVKKGESAALVVLTENNGSTPGKDGSIMAVFEDGEVIGTIGGGSIEYEVIERAKEALVSGEDFEFDYSLDSSGDLGMVCGGSSKGYVKIFNTNEKLIIFGAGHISQKLARIAVKTGFDVYVTDERDQFKDYEDFEGIEKYYVGKPKEVIDKLPFYEDMTYVVICTRGHAHDQEALESVLDKEYRYLGMLGSRTKVSKLTENLIEKGFPEELVNQIHMPIGLRVDDGSVEEIAISIMSEILMVKNNKDGRSSSRVFKENLNKSLTNQ